MTIMVRTHHDENEFPKCSIADHRFGFTLIEILITVAILGVAGSLVIPYMSNLPSFETEAATREIVADLSYAQSDSMARQTKRRVLFEADRKSTRLNSSHTDISRMPSSA